MKEWLGKPASRCEMYCAMIVVTVAFSAVVLSVSLGASRGMITEELMPILKNIDDKIDQMEHGQVTQTNSIQLPPTDSELRDRRLRDIHHSQGTIAKE